MENKTLSEEEASLWSEEISGNYEELMGELVPSLDPDFKKDFLSLLPELTEEQIENIQKMLLNCEDSSF